MKALVKPKASQFSGISTQTEKIIEIYTIGLNSQLVGADQLVIYSHDQGATKKQLQRSGQSRTYNHITSRSQVQCANHSTICCLHLVVLNEMLAKDQRQVPSPGLPHPCIISHSQLCPLVEKESVRSRNCQQPQGLINYLTFQV